MPMPIPILTILASRLDTRLGTKRNLLIICLDKVYIYTSQLYIYSWRAVIFKKLCKCWENAKLGKVDHFFKGLKIQWRGSFQLYYQPSTFQRKGNKIVGNQIGNFFSQWWECLFCILFLLLGKEAIKQVRDNPMLTTNGRENLSKTSV